MWWLGFFVPMLVSLILKAFKTSSFIGNVIAILVGGVLFVDFLGAIYLSVYMHMPLMTSLSSNLAFIPGDTIKAILASLIAYKYKEQLALA